MVWVSLVVSPFPAFSRFPTHDSEPGPGRRGRPTTDFAFPVLHGRASVRSFSIYVPPLVRRFTALFF